VSTQEQALAFAEGDVVQSCDRVFHREAEGRWFYGFALTVFGDEHIGVGLSDGRFWRLTRPNASPSASSVTPEDTP
jgi:hypothetical protein